MNIDCPKCGEIVPFTGGLVDVFDYTTSISFLKGDAIVGLKCEKCQYSFILCFDFKINPIEDSFSYAKTDY